MQRSFLTIFIVQHKKNNHLISIKSLLISRFKKKKDSFIEKYRNLKCCAQFKIQTDRKNKKNKESANDMKFIKGKTF